MLKIGIIGSVLALLLVACSSDPKIEMNVPVIPVITDVVKIEKVTLYFESLGTLKPSQYVEIRPQVSGMIERIDFKEGQKVTKGTPLFAIDSSAYVNKLNEAKAQLAQDEATLQAKRKEFERYASLKDKDLIPKQEWDNRIAAIAENEARLQADHARISNAELDVQHCTIVSPLDGKTGKINVHKGNNVTTSQQDPLVTIAEINPLHVDFTITDKEYQHIDKSYLKENVTVDIHSLYNENLKGKATLTFIDHSFDAKTGLLNLRASLDNPGQYTPGQNVKVLIPFNVINKAKLVSLKSIKVNQSGPYAYVVQPDNTILLKQVKLGEEKGDQVIVLDGLEEGDVVVTEGHLRLAPGVKVEIKKEKSPV
jgi:multidrug efflux system membrane fusion protein